MSSNFLSPDNNMADMQMLRDYSRSHYLVRMSCILAALSAGITGCSSKQDDLLRRASMRKRTEPSEADSSPPVVVAQNKNKQPLAIAARTPAGDRVTMVSSASETSPTVASPSSADEIVNTTAPVNSAVTIEIKPLEERIDDLRKVEPTQFSANSITKLGQAFSKYLREQGHLPRRATFLGGGIESLSWRVELLPYLGYPNLYLRFDHSVPWDSPPNDELLKYIPDEYVAVHRLDTKTNMLGVASPLSIFDTGRANESSIEDGLINTLLAVEANDEFAVPWTMPADYTEPAEKFGRGIGSLHAGGTFAVWGTGLPTLISNTASPRLLASAVSRDDGGGKTAADLHQSILSYLASIEAPAESANPEPPGPNVAANVLEPSTEYLSETAPSRARIAVPSEEERVHSQRMVDELVRASRREIRDEDGWEKLGEQLLKTATFTNDDHAAVYVSLSNARSFASLAKDLPLAMECADAITERFEVNSYDLSMSTIAEYAKSNPDLSVKLSDIKPVVARIVLLAQRAIKDDKYQDALELTRFAIKIETADSTSTAKPKWNRLASLLVAASIKFDEISSDFRNVAFSKADQSAKYSVGQFYCFYKGEWAIGLPLLSKCGNEYVEKLAQADLDGGDSPEDCVNLGDGWLELSAKARPGIFRSSAESRAAYWYTKVGNMPNGSLAKVYVETKLKSLESKLPPNLQLAAVALSEEYGQVIAPQNSRRQADND